MNAMTTRLAAAVVLMAAAMPAANAANILANAGFETGNFNGWTLSGSVGADGVGTAGLNLPLANLRGASSVEVHSGTPATYAEVANLNGQGLTLSQTFTLAAGTYSAGFYYGSSNGPYGNATAIILDGRDLESGGAYIAAGFQEAIATFTLATAGTHTIGYMLSGSGTAIVGISADDFFLNAPVPAPEPSTLAVFGAAILSLFAGRGLIRGRLAI